VKRFTTTHHRSDDHVRPRSRPTIVDVARAAGVSPTTVSYVLSGTRGRADRISEGTRLRVLATAEEIGYVPNQSARSLRLQRSNRVIFLGGRFTSLYSQTIAQSIEPVLVEHGYALEIRIGGCEPLRRAVISLDQHLADGLIVETDDDAVDELRDAARRGHSIVALGPTAPEPSFDVIQYDGTEAIHESIALLLERGFQRFLLMTLRDREPWEPRIATALDALREAGLPPQSIAIRTCPHDRMRAHDLALDLLPAEPTPVAVFAGSDVSAIGVIWAATRLGLRLPRDVAVVGYGNTPETNITVPRLTSIGPDSRDFTIAAELLLSRLAQPETPGRHRAEPYHLSVREST
jgi:LacI family transcriptional regulator